ncbi:hypothetical protein HELRODRAFT_188448 [Helobdella robusta]|uniref:Protein regulator of cytokinesis 1 n=1 Tax=Helobdella robusta TaxID=6412 RepID=T1FPZ9_HELRO|nr:hypothetical protein HELRODRAFT_188448 [Helobdella robusta]ESO06682.1 hypothetical protein HELRODRAFT_188448 [Helobdella robusta]
MNELGKLKKSFSLISQQLNEIETYFGDIGVKGQALDAFGKPFLDDLNKYAERCKSVCNGLKEEAIELKSKMKEDIQANAFEISELCAYLGIDSVQFSLNEGLSLYESLEELKKIVNHLERMKIALELEKYMRIYLEYKELVDEMKLNDHLTDDQKKIYDMNVEKERIFPTEQTLDFISELKVLKENNKAECMKLCSSLKTILNRLNIPFSDEPLVYRTSDDDVFIQQPTVELLRSKLFKYQVLRKTKLKQIRQSVKDEIDSVWAAGHFTEEFKKTCSAYHKEHHNNDKNNNNNNNTDHNDDDDDEEEKEIAALEGYLEKCKCISAKLIPLNEKIESYEETWRELEEVEARLSDPNKFQNRGGKLLKDENLKKKILTILPKNESDIKKELEELKEEFGYMHSMSSSSFADSCDRKWINYHDKKNGEAVNRHRTKMETMNHELRYGSKPAPVNKRHVAWNYPKTTDDIKKKPAPLKSHNPSTHKHLVYGLTRYASKESLVSQPTSLPSHRALQQIPDSTDDDAVDGDLMNVSAYSDGAES